MMMITIAIIILIVSSIESFLKNYDGKWGVAGVVVVMGDDDTSFFVYVYRLIPNFV